MLRFDFFFFVAVIVLATSSVATGGDYQFNAENKYFDKNRTNATALIKQFYAEGQILLIGRPITGTCNTICILLTY